MHNNNWQENEVVKRVIELQRTYVRRHAYAGISSFGVTNVWNLWKCDCCGTLTSHTESLYHKDDNNNTGISLCSVCSDLWNAVDRYYEDWCSILLRSYTNIEIQNWLEKNPKPDHYQGSDYMWMYEEAPMEDEYGFRRKKNV